MTEETQTNEVPTITVNDVSALLRIVDTAAERGAFRGNELTAVGAVRDKAAAFVAYIVAAQEAAEAAAEDEAPVEGAAV